MRQRRILVVEDDRTVAEAVAARLRADGFAVDLAADGPAAVETAARTRPDLVVLDATPPGLDGPEVCRRVRVDRPTTVLMLTAEGDGTDPPAVPTAGADDYLARPFSPSELAARVHALLRRLDGPAPPDGGPLQFGDLHIDRAQRRVWRAGAPVHLTPTEFDLLVRLASRPGTVMSRRHLLADASGWAEASGTRTVDSHIKALRRKLGADLIRTVHGIGYVLEVRQ